MLSPNTASKENSIWTDIDQTGFYKLVKQLDKRKHVPVATVRYLNPLPSNESLNPLSPMDEQLISDDIAFLAACEPGVGYVTAATVQILESKPGILFTLAANHGLTEKARTAMRQLFCVLERRARRGTSIFIIWGAERDG
jgi:hypothetical protein